MPEVEKKINLNYTVQSESMEKMHLKLYLFLWLTQR